MLHQKAPGEVGTTEGGLSGLRCCKQLFARDDGTFPALLKTLSDPSEEVGEHWVGFPDEQGLTSGCLLQRLSNMIYNFWRRYRPTRKTVGLPAFWSNCLNFSVPIGGCLRIEGA